MPKPRVEIMFKRGKPVTAFFHLADASVGRTGRQIAIRPTFVAHYDEAGNPSGLEVPLPLVVSAFQVNDALRELGGTPVDDADLAPLRML